MGDKIKEWMKKIPAEIRTEFMAKLQKCEDKESILALAKEYDLPVTDEIAGMIEDALKTPEILSDADLSAIAGGSWFLPSEVCDTGEDDESGSGTIC